MERKMLRKTKIVNSPDYGSLEDYIDYLQGELVTLQEKGATDILIESTAERDYDYYTVEIELSYSIEETKEESLERLTKQAEKVAEEKTKELDYLKELLSKLDTKELDKIKKGLLNG